jgi:hypothetical protein
MSNHRAGARPKARKGALVMAAGLVGLLAVGCGSEAAQEAAERSPDPVVAAAGKAGDEDTARIRFSVGYSNLPGSVEGEGTFQMVGTDGELRVEAAIPGQPTESFEMMVIEGTTYLSNPQPAPGAPQWYRVPEGTQAVEGPAGTFTDPTEAISLLDSAIDVQEAGTVDIDGEQATLHRGTVDLATGSDDEAERSQLRQMGLEKVPVEVAIDGEGRLRRIVITADLSTAAASMGAGAENPGVMTITVDLVEFGVPLELSPPAADQVADLTAPGAGGAGAAPTTAAA